MSGFLSRYISYPRIVIQCHDNPDADALASGFALHTFFKKKGSDVTFIYGGKNKITKPNLLCMVEELEIPVSYATEIPPCDLLITADCQYGEGNVTKFEAPAVAVIDHHERNMITTGEEEDDLCIRSNLASCSTIVWDLLRSEGVDVNDDIHLSTALYYGLYCDSGQFEELFHPMDRDMRDELKRDEGLLFRLINTNLSMEELGIASRALSGQRFDAKGHFSVIGTEACDPNILGIISDFVIQVEEIDTCVAYNPNPGGYKLSVRSCVPVVKANELAAYLCEGIGNGGGHRNKAGGFISADLLSRVDAADSEEPSAKKDIADVLWERMDSYLRRYEVIDALTAELDRTGMLRYEKKQVRVGYARLTDILKEGASVLVRTLEGDIDLIVEEDIYVMIGVEGEAYPIRKEKFEKSYCPTDGTPEIEAEYIPTIRDNVYGTVYDLREYMNPCVATGETKVLARPLTKPVKVFTAWDREKYYRGEIGDFLVMREDDDHDIYVVRENIFYKTYRRYEA